MTELESLVAQARAPHASLAQRHDAFGRLIARFQDMAYGFAYAILGNAQLAEDVAQEAFLIAYQNLEQLRDPKAFPGWFKRIILSQCNRMARGKRVLTQPIETVSRLPARQPGPLRTIERQELKSQILAAVRALPEAQRTATLLFYIDGYSQREVARFLEISVDAVKKRLQRARETLRERMLDMVRDELRGQRPSNDDQFIRAVHLSTILEQAAQDGQLATLELLLVDGFDVNATGRNGQTLLHWAARMGHLDAIELLVRGGADVNVPDRFGRTPLRQAIEGSQREAADLIRRYGGRETAR